VVVGKSIAAGVPIGAYGMSAEIAALLEPPDESRAAMGVPVSEVATGGTLFGNPLSMAAARVALLDVLTEEAFDRTAALGERMATGLRAAIEEAGLRWSVAQAGAHGSYFFEPEPPRDGAVSRAADDPGLRATIRAFMANRGVWESGWWLGPTVSVAHDERDVDRYVELFGRFVAEVTRT
jgi:glutamate-1-semialdehyde 2,1-aminomutase